MAEEARHRLANVAAAVSGLLASPESTEMGPIAARDVMRFAGACGDVNPLYPARTPPLLLPALVGWGQDERPSERRPDGTPLDDSLLGSLPTSGLRALGGSQNVVLGVDLHEALLVRRVTEITGFEVKEGRAGPLGVVRIRRSFLGVGGDGTEVRLAMCDDEMLLR